MKISNLTKKHQLHSNFSIASWVDGKWTVNQKKHNLTNNLRSSIKKYDFINFFYRYEIWIYLGLFILGSFLRLFELGHRAIHHDESLHGYFSYRLYNGEPYSHNPLMHGMFLFHLLAGSFFMFGDNDFTLRLPIALIGSLLILLPYFFRNIIGGYSSFVISLLITFSPSLVYFSRFARNDILIIFTTVLLVLCVWSYIRLGNNKWLYFSAILVGIGFTIKENQYIVVTILAIFFFMLCWNEIRDWIFGRKSLSNFSREGEIFLLLSLLTLPLSAPIISIFQEPLGITLAASSGNVNLPTGSPDGVGFYIAIFLSLGFLFLSLFLGWIWKKFLYFKIFLFCFIPFVVIFSNFGTQPQGISTGIWQSLGYWLAQHEVSRGSQPWYYYIFLSSIYEFIPLFFSVCFIIYSLFKSTIKSTIIFLTGIVIFFLIFLLLLLQFNEFPSFLVKMLEIIGYVFLLALPFTTKMSKFLKFIFFWFIASFIFYTLAGEKMPWLQVHLTIPAIFLTGILISKIFSPLITHKLSILKKIYIIIFPIFIFSLFWVLILNDIDDGLSLFFYLWIFLIVLGFYILGFFYIVRRIYWIITIKYVLSGIMILLLPFYFRGTILSSFIHGDIPKEPIIYTQTAPHIHQLVEEIDQISIKSNLGYNLPIEIDTRDGFSWPWHWYLRKYKSVNYQDHTDGNVTIQNDRKIIIINTRNRVDFLDNLPNNFDYGREIVHRWWFPEEIYRNKDILDLGGLFLSRDTLNKLFDYYIHRKIDKDLGTINSFVFFSKDIVGED
ncbi:MAG: hypothetical protein CL780_01480 [Chloroflexi bacterium]|nr:hypothetical protein [Chloroflexota bacterium]|tara:strand:- start:619 stop:2949 length:2331 start_codon:yes stop_codon:yes gene_type:complete